MRIWLILLPVFLVILISGCTNIENLPIEQIATSNPVVAAYMTEHPSAEFSFKPFTEQQTELLIKDIRTDCNNPEIEVKRYYRFLVQEEGSNEYVVAWIDAKEGKFLCDPIKKELSTSSPTLTPGTDECSDGATQTCGESDEGICKKGNQTCVDGRWGTCKGEIAPTLEIWNGLDDDCDGKVDNGFGCKLGQTDICGSNIGTCWPGTKTCINGNWSEACEGGVLPTEEICDAYDNDCDGEVNEDDVCTINTCTDGTLQECGIDTLPCKKGNQTCVDGQWGTCEDSIDPETETCDDIDNNCDGNIDEGGVCGASCEAEWFCVSSTSGSYEAYRMENCSIINNNACEFGCEENRCGAAPLIDTNYINYDYRGSLNFHDFPFNFIAPGRFQILRTGERLKIMYRPERWFSDPNMYDNNIDYNAVYDYYRLHLENVGEIATTYDIGSYTWTIPESLNGKKLGGHNYRILVYAEDTNILHAKSQPFDIIPAGDPLQYPGRYEIGDRIKYWLSIGQDPKMAMFGPGTIVSGPKLSDDGHYWGWNISFDKSMDQSKNGWKSEGSLDFLYWGYDTEPLTENNWHYYDAVIIDRDVQIPNTCVSTYYCRTLKSESSMIIAEAGKRAYIFDMKKEDGKLWFYTKYNSFEDGEGWILGDNLRRIVGDSSKIVFDILDYPKVAQKGVAMPIVFRGGVKESTSPIGTFARMNWGDGSEWESKTCGNYLRLGWNCIVYHKYNDIGTYTIKLAVDDGGTNARVEKTIQVTVVAGSDKFEVGEKVKTNSLVSVSAEPRESSSFIYGFGSTGTITKEAVKSGLVFDSSGNVVVGEGSNWFWYVDFDGLDKYGRDLDGWVDETYLSPIDTVFNYKFSIGDNVRATQTVSIFYPPFTGSSSKTKAAGQTGIIEDYYHGPQGKYWYVNWPTEDAWVGGAGGYRAYAGTDGWVAENFLEAV